jgi:hypothetical protein
MSWRDIVKQPEPRYKWKGGSAQCKECKNFFTRPRSSLSISGPTTDKEVIENYKSMRQSGMCKKCFEKSVEPSKGEWPIDRFGNYKGQWPSRSQWKD